MSGKPTSWEDGITFLGQVAFQLRRLLPDAEASQVISRVENWLAEVQVDYQRFQAEAAAQNPAPAQPDPPAPDPVPEPPLVP
jgi:cell division septation protein DedD